MKGIILAGGKGTRLYPITKGVCKQMIPVYDKPLIYYPLSVLMLAGIRDILIISTPKDVPRFQDLFGDGREIGLNLQYAVQQNPGGIAESFLVGEKFIGRDPVCLILGDNIFYGHGLPELLKEAMCVGQGAVIFRHYVKDPKPYGVIELDREDNIISIEEKPQNPKSNWVVTGLYFCDNQVVTIAKGIKPSRRGELEIADVLNEYIRRRQLKSILLGRGYAWLDTGTYDALIDSAIFIKTIEDRQGLKIGCVEEIAYRMGYISAKQLKDLAARVNTSYSDYLLKMLE